MKTSEHSYICVMTKCPYCGFYLERDNGTSGEDVVECDECGKNFMVGFVGC